jgi:hypothetical protein
MTIARFTPLTDVVSLREAMDRLFEDSFIPSNGWAASNGHQISVPVDLWETADAYHLRADLPGLSPDDIEINATADTFTIRGEIKPGTDVTPVRQVRALVHRPNADRPEQSRGEVPERRARARPSEGRERQATLDQDQRLS